MGKLKQLLTKDPLAIRNKPKFFEGLTQDEHKELSLFAIGIEASTAAATHPQKSMTNEEYDRERSAEKRLSLKNCEKVLYDELGNLRTAYEIVRYEKRSNGEWVEEKRYNTLGRSNFVIDGKIYFEVNDTLIPMNMNFEHPSCGACERVISEIPVTHKMTNNEELGDIVCTWNSEGNAPPLSVTYQLRAQHYSDHEPFYYLTKKGHSYASSPVGWGNRDKATLIEYLRSHFAEKPEFVDEIERRIIKA